MGFRSKDEGPWLDPARTRGWLDRVPRPSRKAAVPSSPPVTKDEQQPRPSPEEERRGHLDALLKQRDAWRSRLDRGRGLEFRLRCLKEIAFLDEQIQKLENGAANSDRSRPSKKGTRKPKKLDDATDTEKLVIQSIRDGLSTTGMCALLDYNKAKPLEAWRESWPCSWREANEDIDLRKKIKAFKYRTRKAYLRK